MKISLYDLNKDQTNILKAIAITLIVFHNFLHLIAFVGENEMWLDPDRIFRLFDIISNPENRSISLYIRELASYIGWAGVPIFVFISGFGLTKTFIRKEPSGYIKYLVPRLKKLYLLFLFAYIIYFFMLIIALGEEFNKYDYIRFTILSLLAMPIKNYNLHIAFLYIGPGWYFCLASQLYILFPLLFKYSKKYKLQGCLILLAIAYILIYITIPIANKFGYPIYANFIGHLPEFILGIMLAMYKEIKITWKTVLAATILFALANFYQTFYPFTFISFSILLITITYPIYSKISPANFGYKTLVFIGKISMFMFVINAPIRNLYTLRMAEGQEPSIQIAISVLHFIIVVTASYLLSIIYNKTGEGFDYLKRKLLSLKNRTS